MVINPFIASTSLGQLKSFKSVIPGTLYFFKNSVSSFSSSISSSFASLISSSFSSLISSSFSSLIFSSFSSLISSSFSSLISSSFSSLISSSSPLSTVASSEEFSFISLFKTTSSFSSQATKINKNNSRKIFITIFIFLPFYVCFSLFN